MSRSIASFSPNPSTGPGTAHKATATTNNSRRSHRESTAAHDDRRANPAARIPAAAAQSEAVEDHRPVWS